MEARPVPTDYRTIADFLKAMDRWRRTSGGPSLRAATAGVRRCSPSLVSQVMTGKRRLTVDRLDAFAKVFGLDGAEKQALRRWIESEESGKAEERKPRGTRLKNSNHVFSHWTYPIVKDAVTLRGCNVDSDYIAERLGGVADKTQVERALKFLLREGYLRRTLDGRIVENDAVVSTTDEVPSAAIRAFHRKALEIARDAIPKHPVERRQSATVTIALTEADFRELKQMAKDFYERVLAFAEEHPEPGDELYLFTMHLVPVAKSAGEGEPS